MAHMTQVVRHTTSACLSRDGRVKLALKNVIFVSFTSNPGADLGPSIRRVLEYIIGREARVKCLTMPSSLRNTPTYLTRLRPSSHRTQENSTFPVYFRQICSRFSGQKGVPKPAIQPSIHWNLYVVLAGGGVLKHPPVSAPETKWHCVYFFRKNLLSCCVAL